MGKLHQADYDFKLLAKKLGISESGFATCHNSSPEKYKIIYSYNKCKYKSIDYFNNDMRDIRNLVSDAYHEIDRFSHKFSKLLGLNKQGFDKILNRAVFTWDKPTRMSTRQIKFLRELKEKINEYK